VDTAAVLARLQALRAPERGGPPDPVTKLWPRHLGAEALRRQVGGAPAAERGAGSAGAGCGAGSGAVLKARFPDYFALYGYE